jgi:hypothetical protein
MSNIDVSSIEIRDFAQSLGWALSREALQDGLFVLDSPTGDGTQLEFPKDIDAPEFAEMARISIKRLCEFYKTSPVRLVEEIREVNDDVLSLRYFSQSKIVNSLSFEEAYETIAATRQMLLSAASSIVHPAIYHPKLNRSEPQELIKKARFRHTQEGSFILKVAIPFEQAFATNSLFGSISEINPERSLGRQTVELISKSSKEIIDSIESNSIKELFETQVVEEKPIISYNFCDSLLRMFDEERELPFELIFNWSRSSLKSIPKPQVPDRVAFPFAYLSKLNELKEYLTPQKPEINDTFIGTVEELNGDLGLDGRRSGEVILNLLVGTEIVKTKLNLNADQYHDAIRAHERGPAYVRVRGKLHIHARLGRLDEIIEFRMEN